MRKTVSLLAPMALAMLLASGSAFRKPTDRGCKADLRKRDERNGKRTNCY
jgi:hypothetical protein